MTEDPPRTAIPMWQGAIAASEACNEQILRCAGNVGLLLPAESAALLRRHGATFSGAFFGAGWWCWADACTSGGGATKVSFFPDFLPGIVATIALVMINAVRREELSSSEAFEEEVFCRARAWLFMSYVVAFASVIGATMILLAGKSTAIGVACLMQVILILAAALVFFVARTPIDGDEYSSF